MWRKMVMFEVNIQISSTMEQIVSPCNLARAIGVPPGAKLRLRRDTAKEEQSRMVVRCDRRAASLLRRRFSKPRPYAHEGQLTSLHVVSMTPVVDHGDNGGAVLRPAEGGAKSPRYMGVATAPPPSSSPVAGGVEVALEVIERAKADGLHVPGVAELYGEFFAGRRVSAVGRRKGAGTRRRRSNGAYNEEEKKRELEENKESGESAISSDEAKQDASSPSSEGSSCSSAENGPWHKPVTLRQHRRPSGRHTKYRRNKKTGEEKRRELT